MQYKLIVLRRLLLLTEDLSSPTSPWYNYFADSRLPRIFMLDLRKAKLCGFDQVVVYSSEITFIQPPLFHVTPTPRHTVG